MNDNSELEYVDAEIVPDLPEPVAEIGNTAIAPVPDRAMEPAERRRAAVNFIVLPLIFLSVSLLGGLRFAAADNAFIFLKPPLVSLVFACVLIVSFVRSGLIDLRSRFSENSPVLENIANGAVLLTLFTASAQIFNSLLPEKGLPFWVVGFCFGWTLWNDLFAAFDAAKLLRSLGALFALAFVSKFLVLANLTATGSESWLMRVFENPGKETLTWMLDLPKYSAATGYVQFLAAALFLIGLYLTPRSNGSAN